MAGRGRGLLEGIRKLKMKEEEESEGIEDSEKVLEKQEESAPKEAMVPQSFGRGQMFQYMFQKLKEKKKVDEDRGEPSSSTSTETIEPPMKPIGRGFPLTKRGIGRGFDLPEPPKMIGAGESGGALPKPIGRGIFLKKDFPATPRSLDTSTAPSETSSVSEVLSEPNINRGKKGKVIPLYTNYIRLKLLKDVYVYEYHVSFNPQVDSMKLRRRFLHEIKRDIGQGQIFDGAKLYLPIRLEKPLTTIKVKHPYAEAMQSVLIKYVTKQRIETCEHLFNVLFKRIMNLLQLKLVRRNYFDPKQAKRIPDYKLQIWPGYVTSVTRLESGLLLMCDAAHKVLRDCTALDVLGDCRRRGGNWKAEAEKELIGSVVMTKYNNKTYRIDDIEWNKNVNSTFKDFTGSDIRFVDYYKKSYQIDIKDPDQPMLLNRAKPNRGTVESKMINLVPELSHMTGVTDEMRNNFQMMKSIAMHTRLTPNLRQMTLRRFLRNMHENQEASQVLLDWGVALDTDIMNLEGRKMDPVKLMYGNGSAVVNERADWTSEVCRNKKVYTSVDFRDWVIIYVGKDQTKAVGFKQKMLRAGPPMGIEISEPKMIVLPNDRIDAYVNAINKVHRDNPRLQIIVTICPTSRDDRYAAIKKVCYLELGIPSQVINVRTISREDKLLSVTQKIILQMNCKLGGELWGVNCPLTNLMVIGIDVYHDASQRGKSVVGFVCSLNGVFTRWFSKTCAQNINQELGDGLRSCMIAALKWYLEVNRTLPSQICIYRDGVSDGQLKFVEEHEINQIVQSFSTGGPDYHPKLTVVIVQKRINTRIFASIGREVVNPMPGTVLDHTVTRFKYYDFFLVSQHVNQGTVTPSHYIVLRDDNKFSPDVMQKLSYVLTHMYFNWPGTVRVPAPCQYAHKLAQMTGQHLHKEVQPQLSDKLFFL